MRRLDAVAYLLDGYTARESDPLGRGYELVHRECGEALCAIDDDDDLMVLALIAEDHHRAAHGGGPKGERTREMLLLLAGFCIAVICCEGPRVLRAWRKRGGA